MYIYIILDYTFPDFLRFEHSVCLEPTFFFHINAFKGQNNP